MPENPTLEEIQQAAVGAYTWKGRDLNDLNGLYNTGIQEIQKDFPRREHALRINAWLQEEDHKRTELTGYRHKMWYNFYLVFITFFFWQLGYYYTS